MYERRIGLVCLGTRGGEWGREVGREGGQVERGGVHTKSRLIEESRDDTSFQHSESPVHHVC